VNPQIAGNFWERIRLQQKGLLAAALPNDLLEHPGTTLMHNHRLSIGPYCLRSSLAIDLIRVVPTPTLLFFLAALLFIGSPIEYLKQMSIVRCTNIIEPAGADTSQ
jgi:hypothetical protein